MRTVTTAATLTVLVLAVATCRPSAPDSIVDSGQKAGTSVSGPIDVSLIALIATPERYANAIVRVDGYAVFEFEGEALYLHKEDHERGLGRNGLWLELTESTRKRIPRSPGYAVVEGKFAPTQHGHMDAFSGSIVEVSRVQELLSREDIHKIQTQSPDAAK